jgi:hypothetical protein
MHPGYLTYLESRPALPGMGTLLRLAGVLQTSPAELLGGRVMVPPGQGAPPAHPRLVELDADECWRLVGPGGVGRIVVSDSSAPAAIPVNYSVHERAIAFRTGADTILAHHLGESVAFEVDHVDDAMKEGWSVLVTGVAQAVDEAAGSQQDTTDTDSPWAGGERSVRARVDPQTITGRRILVHGPKLPETP